MNKLQKKNSYWALRACISYIATFKYRFFLVFCFLLAATVLVALMPLFIGNLTETLATQPIDRSHVYFLIGVLILLSVGNHGLWHAGDWLYRWLLNAKQYEFETILFRSVIARPYPYFIDKFTGKISSYVTGLGREFREFLDAICYQYVNLFVTLPVVILVVFSVNLVSGVIFVASLIAMLISGRYLVDKMNEAEADLTDESSSLDGRVIDIISNFVSVKAFRREMRELNSVIIHREKVMKKSSRKMFWEIWMWTAMGGIVRIGMWPLLLVINVTMYLNGQISLGQLTTLIAALVMFTEYIWDLLWHLSELNLKFARMEESYTYLFGKNNIIHDQEGKTHGFTQQTPEFKHELSLDKLTFAYPDKPDSPVLKDISLTVRKNEKIGVVGASGSGKTTLIKLLLGYYQVSRDMVALDGTEIDNRGLVGLIAYVPQDTALFHRTIGENIAYGSDKTVTQSEIELAAKRAHAHEFIMQIDKVYDALVGERGIKLSMGQRQRVAIARAFLDPKPILVLDEATSALDSESEVLVQRALEDLWHDRTVIAIAHRLSTLRHMDRIIVLDKGRLIEEGTHAELLAQKGKYYRLWQHQSGGLLIEE